MAGIEWHDASDDERDDYTGEYDDWPEPDDDGSSDYFAAQFYEWREDSDGNMRLWAPVYGFIG